VAPWWERFPGRLDAEREEFQARDLDFELDEAQFRDAGRVLLRGSVVYEGDDLELEVLYPDLYPYLRPEVFAPGLSLPRHQNPSHYNLCLLDRNTRAWSPVRTAAWLVAERVPYLLSLIEGDPEAMRAAEVPQGEPASSFFPTPPGMVVFVPADALGLDHEHRRGSGRLHFGAEAPPRIAIRALLGELVVRSQNRKTKVIARADDALARRFSGDPKQMRWVRLDAAPQEFTAEGVFAAAEEAQSGFGRPPWQPVADGEIAVTGVVFPEEVRQSEYEDAWLFAVRFRRHAQGHRGQGTFVIRGERLTPEDLGARIPALSALRDATIAQVGLGALGAPLALELARSQVGAFRLLENDRVEAAQIVRWPFGISAVGHQKLEAVAGTIVQNYPYTRVERFDHHLGQTALDRQNRSENELDLLDRFLGGASLLLDASAELGLQYLLSDLARERGLAQIYVSATEGARGGQIALIVPTRGGCWHCWGLHQRDRTIPLPPSDPAATVQPRGCAAPTFTGAGFDLLPITAQAARVASAALGGAVAQSTVWVCDMPDDGVGAPLWTPHEIPRREDCPFCS
jgi:hypothetical protein